MEMHENIKALREKRGLSQEALAEKTGYKDRSSIAKIEAGLVDLPQSKIALFAEALGVTPIYLMGLEQPKSLLELVAENNGLEEATKLLREIREKGNLPTNVTPLPPMDKVPLVGKIACGTPILAEQNIEDYIDLPRHIHADFALTCEGDSMINLGIHDGDVVYIRQQEEVENGQVAAVRVGDEEATLKRFYFDGDVIQLVPENSRYRPLVFTGENINQVHVIGLAVAYTRAIE